MKKLLGLIVIFHISCNGKKVDNNTNYFINKDFKNIVDEIIIRNSLSNNITISLEDNKTDTETEIWIFGFGFFDDCKNVKKIFQYNNKVITLIDNSEKSSFDALIDLSKINTYKECEIFIKELENIRTKDYISFSYIYRDTELYYLNNHPIEYKNDKILLEKFIIEN